MKVAIVHDWFVTYAGSERVVEQLLALFPQSDLFSLVDFLPDGERAMLRGKPVRTTFVQRLPMARKRYTSYLPLMPLAIEQLDLTAYDLVLSSSHCVAKGVITGPDQLHVSYVHTPMRYAWDLQHEYLAGAGLVRGLRGLAARYLLHKLRMWDVRTSHGVDSFVANSAFIARRIWKTYRRHADVIHPPVDTSAFTLGEQREDFYVTASRLVPYKRVDVLVEAFGQLPGKRLVVIGDGPELARLRQRATANVSFLGFQKFDVLHDHLRRARAFLFAAREDFGIVSVEAQAAGSPVIAFGRGGAVETIRTLDCDQPTGMLFTEQNADCVAQAIATFERESHRFRPVDCRANALLFGVERFRNEMLDHVRGQWESFDGRSHCGGSFDAACQQAGEPARSQPVEFRPLRAA